MAYRTGELDQKIKFQREDKTSDGMGGNVVTIVDIANGVWCKVDALSGKESERFDKLNAEELTKFVTRYRTDIKEDDIIEYLGVQYNIRYIPKRSTRTMYAEFFAERGVAL